MSHDIQFHIPCPYHDFNYRRWPPGTTMRAHSHHFFQIIHVLEGDFHVDSGAGWQCVPPGYAHILPPGCAHALRTGSGHLQLGLNFRPKQDERGWIHRLCRHFPAPCQKAAELSTSLRNLLESPPFLFDELTQLRVISLFDAYCLSLLQQTGQSAELGRKNRLLELLESRCREPLSVPQVATAMQMSRAAVQRLCATHFGCGIHSLHQQIRITQAARLLARSDLTIGECAHRCGYPDIYTFSRIFKRLTGASPTDYRTARPHRG